MIRFRVLGSVELTGPDGEEVASVLAQPKRTALLAYLALATPRGFHRRDKIVGLFWPESDHDRARASLRRAIHFLRKSLGGDAIMGRGNGELSLNPDLVWSDVEAFRGALKGGDLEGALGLYRGDLLEGYFLSGCPDFERWLDGERDELRREAARAAWALAHQNISRGQLKDAERTGQRALELNPTDENEIRGFMEALARAGDRAAAMRLYEKFASDLSDDLDLEPSAATKTAVHSIRTGHATVDERLSLAALPWVNWSGREEDLYFTDGIHAEILTRLSMVGGFRVIARQSVVRFRDSPKSIQEIAGELGVRYLLEAGLLRATDSVRINVQLIDARLDDHIWADSFDFPLSMKNLLSAQTEIAQRVADQLKTVLRSEETTRIQAPGTTDLAAYDLYLLGRHRFRERSVQNLQAAIGYFEAAINKDANFALAWAGLADAWSVLPWYDRIPTREAYASGLGAARKALDLNPELAEVHTALGGLALYHEWDWKASEEYLLRALELNPNYAQAYHFLAMAQFLLGHGERAMDSMQMAATLNPLGNNFLHTLAAGLYDAGRSEEAVAAFRKADQLEPPVPYGLMNASSFLFKEGRAEEAFRTIRKWGRVMGYPNPEGLPLILEARDDPSLTSEALALLEDVRSVLGLRAGDLVGVYLHLHDLAEAVRMVKESIAERHVVVPFLGMEPSRSEVLAMPEARAALVEVGVPYL